MTTELYLKRASERITSAQQGLGQKLAISGIYDGPEQFLEGSAHQWLERAAEWMKCNFTLDKIVVSVAEKLPTHDGYHPPVWTDVVARESHGVLIVETPVHCEDDYAVRLKPCAAAVPDDITGLADDNVELLHQVQMDIIYETRFSAVRIHLMVRRPPQRKSQLIDHLFELYGLLHQHKRIVSPPEKVHPSLLG